MISAGTKKKRFQILVIDAEAREYYRALIAAVRNCYIVVKKNNQKGCEFFFRNKVDLVLLNHIPTDPCIDLLQVLKFVAPSVPVIIMTAWGSEEFAVSMLRNGASDYLKKPLNIDELGNSIKTALGRKNGLLKGLFNQSTDGINKAIHYIDGNYCLPLKLTRVAREAGMSVSCLERAFKKKLGVTFSVYLNKVRISRSIQMLEQGIGSSIGEIAYACGFTNQYHFTRLFKKMVQYCPRDFKKALTENRLYT
jgi:YesN/AraC family two-component response regulator